MTFPLGGYIYVTTGVDDTIDYFLCIASHPTIAVVSSSLVEGYGEISTRETCSGGRIPRTHNSAGCR